MEIGKIIKKYRTEKNMTQEELASILFVSRQLISKWENNKSYPDLNQLIQLSDYFNLSLDELMRGDRQMIKKKDTQVTIGKRSVKVGIICLGILGLVGIYFIILHAKINYLYRNINNSDWKDEGITFVQRGDSIQYDIFKIKSYNIFTIPKTLPVSAMPINIDMNAERHIINSATIDFDGNMDNFYITWLTGPLENKGFQMSSSFEYDTNLQKQKNLDISNLEKETINKELDVERPYLDSFLSEIEKKWQEINK